MPSPCSARTERRSFSPATATMAARGRPIFSLRTGLIKLLMIFWGRISPESVFMKRTFLLPFIILLVAGCDKSISINDLTAPEALHSRAVGASAGELLKSEKYTSLKLELQYMPGYAPDAAAVDHLKSMLAGLVNKPGGISVVYKEIPASP